MKRRKRQLTVQLGKTKDGDFVPETPPMTPAEIQAIINHNGKRIALLIAGGYVLKRFCDTAHDIAIIAAKAKVG